MQLKHIRALIVWIKAKGVKMVDGYTQVFDSSDGTEAGTDIVVGFIVGIAGFIALIALIWVIGYLRKKSKGLM